ncbi:strawberry notch C-terminal domain-containing protein [Pararhizobium sp. BT-229]|uniref:strawberry notch C-terminal domain-containing protein n=1 Tax=Pararhizobium sp. BT-229 TaxID=2986923 RepID=UPI0021F6B844|nr:strawberry notch C-terminal domain-containing protein [Pararhizobium sp. BT-229]MCV9965064.1 strawberry notch C-terminal domain-containing protein [Pararhizobium sp. BT-229]
MLIEDNATTWVNLKHGNFEVIAADFAQSEGEWAIVVRGDGQLSKRQAYALSQAGFVRIAGPRTVWARRGGNYMPSELVHAFPNLRKVRLPRHQTRVRFRGVSPFLPAVEVKAAVEEPRAAAVEAAAGPDGGRKDNAFQSVYIPASKLGTPIAMVPVNMKKPTAAALARIEEEHGPIDDFLATRLGYDLEKLEKVLSPEQVDAAAMAIAATYRNREMLLADQTGLGKGRVLASVMLAAAREGKTVVFITEKANLFSDIYRDLGDIEAVDALGKPFLLNSGSSIIDLTSLNGDKLYEALPDPELRKMIKGGKLPEGCRFLMCTYSQFNRMGSAKEKFLTEVAKDAYVVVDEAHNAAGADSNTSASLENGLAGAWGVIRSSATFARDGEALLKYPRVLPPGLRSEDVRIALQAGGNSMAEAVAQYLAEDGVLIRREHDLSGIRIDVVVDDERKALNMEYSDALAPILSRLAQLQRMVDDEIETRNEDAQKEGGKAAGDKWYSANFGSRRAPLLRQFLTALSVDFCIDRCVKALLDGEKPVVVIEQTMESLMRELAGLSTQEPDPDQETTPEAEEQALALQGTQAPDFRAALLMMMDRILHMTVRRGKEDPEKIPVDDPYTLAEAENIKAMIERFPPLSLSPIDDIRDRIEAISHKLLAGGLVTAPWKADEISARNLRVTDGLYTPMKKANRNDTIVAFNNGGIDALVITRAASTGLSLHASEKVRDQRRRRMIELQIPANVVERVQFWGRVNRRGQVSSPGFETLSTGLPSQMRSLAMNNRKVEKLSATVSANAATATAMDVPDMIDSVGNMVAMRILSDQPSIAERMFIAMKNIDPEMAEQELYYINKYLQGFPYLKSEESEELFARLLKDYNDAVEGMKAQGKTPRGVRELEGTWREVSRERYEEGSDADGPVFGRPVDVVVMEGLVERDPISAAKVHQTISAARTRLGQLSGKVAGPYFDAEIKQIGRNRRSVLKSALGGRYISEDAALKDREPNAVKSASERLARLVDILSAVSPGLGLDVPGPDDTRRYGIIVDVRLRSPDLPHQPGEWTVRYAVPGDAAISEISIATLMREKGYRLHTGGGREALDPDLRNFDRAPRGLVPERKTFLDGNFVRAMLIATEISAGSMVSFVGDDGERRRSVLISERGHRALADRKSRIVNSDEAMRFLANGQAVYSEYRSRSEGLILRRDDYGFAVIVPRSKDWEKFRKAGPGQIAGAFKPDRGGGVSARIADNKVKPFLDAVFGFGLPLYFDNRTIKAKQNSFAGGPRQASGPSFGGPRQQSAPSFQGGPRR